MPDAVLEKLCALEEGLAALAPLLTKIVMLLEAQQAAPPVATFADVYADSTPRSGSWRTLFPRKETS